MKRIVTISPFLLLIIAISLGGYYSPEFTNRRKLSKSNQVTSSKTTAATNQGVSSLASPNDSGRNQSVSVEPEENADTVSTTASTPTDTTLQTKTTTAADSNAKPKPKDEIESVDLGAARVASNIVPKNDHFRKGEMIIKYKESAVDLNHSNGQQEANSFRETNSLKRIGEIKELNMDVVKTEGSVEETIEKLAQLPTVEYAEPNYIRQLAVIPNDPYFNRIPKDCMAANEVNGQWALFNEGKDYRYSCTGNNQIIYQTNDIDVDAPEAWDIEIDHTANPTTVAVIDTGVTYDHEDLAANMWDGSAGCFDQFGTPIDGNCPHHGWNFKTDVAEFDPAPDDPYDAMWTVQMKDPTDNQYKTYSNNGHGSNVAGIIAGASNNSVGISGMSYRNNLRVMALRFDLSIAQEISAINFAKFNGARVINASFAGGTPTNAERDAIANFPGIFVAASGNSGVNVDGYPTYPCSYDLRNVICVGSHGPTGAMSYFSNYSATSVDILAPGERILSAISPKFYYAGVEACAAGDTTCYAYMSGTSQASPHVAALAGLIFNQNPALSTEQVRNIIINSGDPMPAMQNIVNSPRRMNLANAIRMAQAGPTNQGGSSLYKLRNTKKKKYLYTASEAERNKFITDKKLKKLWKYESSPFYVYPTKINDSLVPLYRFYKKSNNKYYYTTNETEKNSLIAKRKKNKFTFQGVAWYVYPTRQADTNPVYRFYSKSMDTYFFTSSEGEKNYMILAYPVKTWKYEGIAWYTPQY